MASDIAEMLKQNFLECVRDSELNLASTITPLLTDIANEFTNNKVFWSPPPVKSLSYLYQLDHTLAECRANKRTFLSSCLDPVERSNEKTLTYIKHKLIQMRGNNTENANSTSILFTSSMYPTRKDAPNITVFEKEIEKIVTWLESNDGFKAIGVHGMCGTGKTTLVKMVLDDQRVRKKYEEPLWVCLYDLTSSDEMDIKIVKEMLAQLGDDPDLLTEQPDLLTEEPDLLTAEPKDDWLVERLHEKLKGRRYLIVLDGVWHCNEWFNNLYDNNTVRFSQALPKDEGGAVIVTSRQKEVTTNSVGYGFMMGSGFYGLYFTVDIMKESMSYGGIY
ncbi:putative disease resistance protein RGA1 [Cajanus cajan]|uniref:putative disease resistance protein RGA1 n=1 Tax=Cajanus cajan TaxID=3821 RepID=UPI00098D7A25|nr:putative disease resistance protein RGA1 [Cajanus cajan]